MRPIPMPFRDLYYVFLVFALPGGMLTPAQAQTGPECPEASAIALARGGIRSLAVATEARAVEHPKPGHAIAGAGPIQVQAENDTPQFYLGLETLREVELSRPGCDTCPWWVYGNTYGIARDLAVGLVFRTLSSGPISSRMHCYNAGCNGATSMFADSSDNFNQTGDYYCAAGFHNGLSPSQICGQIAPGAYVLHLGNHFPFNRGGYLAGGFKTGGDRSVDAYLRVHDIRFVYFGVPKTAPAPDPTAVPIKLLVVIYDPILESSGG